MGEYGRVALGSCIASLLIAGTTLKVASTPIDAGGPPSPAVQETTRLLFDVASVRDNRLGSQERRAVTMRMLPNGRYEATNVSVRLLIMRAYGVRDFQIVGGPSWIRTDRFDIHAKAPENFEPGQTQDMVRSLLAERFGLVIRTEKREFAVYSLVRAGNGRTLGLGIRRVTPECEAMLSAGSPLAAASTGGRGVAGGAGGRSLGPSLAGDSMCGREVAFGMGAFTMKGNELSTFVSRLTEETRQIVIDRTGLTGHYDIDLRWGTDRFVASPGTSQDLPPDSGGPSIFTALREQLGFKLESVKAPVDVLVIEAVSRPSDD